MRFWVPLLLLASSPVRAEPIVGVCALVLKFGEWTEKVTIPISEASQKLDLDLSNKKTFTYSRPQPDGTEVIHEGTAPPQLHGYNVRIQFQQDVKIGWAGHEEIVASFMIFERKNRSRMEGPFKATVIRKHNEVRETTEDLPFVAGTVKVAGEKLEFRFGCSKALGR